MERDFVNIILGSSEWKYYHRKEFTKELVANGEEIAYFNLPVSLTVNLFIKFRSKFIAYFRCKNRLNKENGFIVYTPLMLFHYILWRKSSLLAIIDSFFMSILINRFINKYYSCKKVRLWVYLPEHKYLIGKVNYNLLIYDSYDDYELNFDGSINKKRAEYNKILLSKSDFVLVVSKYSFDKYSKYAKNIFRSRNGYSLNIFDNNNQKIIITDSNKPVLGYIGVFRNWIDYSLIESLISSNEFVIVFIGYIERNSQKYFEELLKNEKVIHINHIDISLIPSYVKNFSVGLIPFITNDFMNSVYPNKLFEYISSDIPVVSTALPELEKFKDYIGYSKNNEEFIENCRKAIDGKFSEKVSKYNDIKKNNDWKTIVKEVLKEVNKLN